MGLRINTNQLALTAQRNLGNTTARLQGNYSKLSSGLRIATAADDAAGLGISERMRSQIRSFGQAQRNAQDGVSLVQTAEGALNEVSSNLTRMRELAIQSANGTLSQEDRDVVQAEFTALTEELDRIASDTNFNGTELLNNTNSTTIQVGTDASGTIDVTNVDTQASALGFDSTVGVDDATSARDALAVLDTAINSVSTARGSLGAFQNRLQSTIRSIGTNVENLSASESRIRDVDVARETADLTRNSILQQAAVSVLSQANTQPQLALGLLG